MVQINFEHLTFKQTLKYYHYEFSCSTIYWQKYKLTKSGALVLHKVCESVPMHARDISTMEADTAKVKKVDPS